MQMKIQRFWLLASETLWAVPVSIEYWNKIVNLEIICRWFGSTWYWMCKVVTIQIWFRVCNFNGYYQTKSWPIQKWTIHFCGYSGLQGRSSNIAPKMPALFIFFFPLFQIDWNVLLFGRDYKKLLLIIASIGLYIFRLCWAQSVNRMYR